MIRHFRTWQAFLLYNQKLGAQAIEPRKAFSLVLDRDERKGGVRNVTANGMQPDPYCVDLCYAEYNECLDSGVPGCESQHEECFGSCPIICVEPRSQTSTTTTQNWDGPYNTGPYGCYQGYYYYQTAMQRKHTTITTTTSCYNSTSMSTSEWYSYQYCWSPTPITCHPQTLWYVGCSGY